MSSIQNVESDIHDSMGNSIGVNIIDSEYVVYTNADSNVNLQLVDNEYINTVNIDSNVNLQLVDDQYINTTKTDNILVLDSVTHEHINTSGVHENVSFKIIDMVVGRLDTSHLSNKVDKIEHVNDTYKTVSVLNLYNTTDILSHTIDKSSSTNELYSIYLVDNIDYSCNTLSLDNINTTSDRDMTETYSELNFSETLIAPDRKSEQLISYNSGYIFDISYKAVNKTELSAGSLIDDNIERRSSSRVGTKSFFHSENQIDKNKSRIEAGIYEHITDDSYSDLNIIYGRLSFIRHTSDVSDFRIFEKLASNTNIN